MASINEITKVLRNKKEEWERHNDVKVNFKDVNSGLTHKASSWITFQDCSGEIKIYEEDSAPNFDDLDLGGVGRDILLGGASLLIPVAGPWIAGAILGFRGGKIIGTAALTELAWKNTYLFIFNALKKCVFAMEFHYLKEDNFRIVEALQSIEEAVKDLEAEIYSDRQEDDSEWEYEDDENSEWEYEDDIEDEKSSS